MHKKHDNNKENHSCSWGGCCGHGSSLYWGIALVLLGAYLIANHTGLITLDLPFWGVALLVFGGLLVFKNIHPK